MDKVVDWSVLPPAATAPIGNATQGISECAADPGPLESKAFFIVFSIFWAGDALNSSYSA